MVHKVNVLLVLFLCLESINGQQISIQSLNTAGKSSTVGNIRLEDAIGGFLVSSYNLPAIMYTQDFLQPDAGTTSGPLYINDVRIDRFYALDNAGTTYVAGGSMVEFTLGETLSATASNSNNMLTQGLLQPYHLFKWTGLVNTSWINTGNWSTGLIPINSDEVLIPTGCPNYPIIANAIIARCRLITLNTGASTIIENGGSLWVSTQQ